MQKPIGIFDSGLGGLSIWQEIAQLMPYESTIYLADSKNAPYGNQTKEEIIHLSIKNADKLIDMGAKIIVVACNTATTNAIKKLRESYEIPFIGIEPAIKPAALNSKNNRIGILATRGTLNSALFHKTSQKYTQDSKVIEIIGEGLVPLIESGDLENPVLLDLLESFVTPMIKAEIDTLVLGCSHYPFLIPLLHKLLPKSIKIIDSGEAVARQTKHVLNSIEALNSNPKNIHHHIITNGNLEIMNGFLERFRESETLTNSNSLIEHQNF